MPRVPGVAEDMPLNIERLPTLTEVLELGDEWTEPPASPVPVALPPQAPAPATDAADVPAAADVAEVTSEPPAELVLELPVTFSPADFDALPIVADVVVEGPGSWPLDALPALKADPVAPPAVEVRPIPEPLAALMPGAASHALPEAASNELVDLAATDVAESAATALPEAAAADLPVVAPMSAEPASVPLPMPVQEPAPVELAAPEAPVAFAASAVAATLPVSAPTQTQPLDAVELDAAEIVDRVLRELQPRIEALLEQRLREALAPALASVADGLIRDTRAELASVTRELVQESVTAVMRSHRG